jgi:hypothetical protein
MEQAGQARCPDWQRIGESDRAALVGEDEAESFLELIEQNLACGWFTVKGDSRTFQVRER